MRSRTEKWGLFALVGSRRHNAGMPSSPQALRSFARDLGFDVVAIAPTGPSPDHDRYAAWITPLPDDVMQIRIVYGHLHARS